MEAAGSPGSQESFWAATKREMRNTIRWLLIFLLGGIIATAFLWVDAWYSVCPLDGNPFGKMYHSQDYLDYCRTEQPRESPY